MNVVCQCDTITLVIMMKANFSCGDRIRELRTERAMSQERVALSAGITPAYLGQVERGQKNATVAIVERICAAMNVSLSEFFSPSPPATEMDLIEKQLLSQLKSLNHEEKLTCLHIIENAVQLCKVSSKDSTTL